jgi:hypothetical protein
MHLMRYYGVFAPHSKMNWARRLKRVFGIDIERCTRCGGKLNPDHHQPELPPWEQPRRMTPGTVNSGHGTGSA